MSSVRQVLQRFGVFPDIAIMQMFIAPNTTDPDMQSTIAIVQGIQRGLNELGFGLHENGILNAKTAAALDRVCGEGWRMRAWLSAYSEVEKAIRLKPTLKAAVSNALSDFTPVTSGFGTAAVLGAIAVGYLLFVRRS
jgi:hypothetical protein